MWLSNLLFISFFPFHNHHPATPLATSPPNTTTPSSHYHNPLPTPPRCHTSPPHCCSLPIGGDFNHTLAKEVALITWVCRSRLEVVRMVVPLKDTKNEDLLDYLKVYINFIDRSKKEGSILVHCFARVSRRFHTLLLLSINLRILWVLFFKDVWRLFLGNELHCDFWAFVHCNVAIITTYLMRTENLYPKGLI